MTGYRSGTSLAHRLDPRTKIILQAAVVIAAYAHTEPFPLAMLTLGALGCVRLAGDRVYRLIWELRYLIALLTVAPILAAIQPGSPWIDLTSGYYSALSAYRVFLIVSVGMVLVRTTSPQETRAAIEWMLPGRPGRVLATGVSLVFQFLPLLITEFTRTRAAMDVRLAERRRLSARFQVFGIVALARIFQRSDRIANALRVRCLSWNPTPANIHFATIDAPVLAIAGGLLLWVFI